MHVQGGRGAPNGRALNQALNRTASAALHGVDLVLLLVQAMVWNEDDQRAWDTVVRSGVPFLLVVNKVDTIKHKSDLLPYLSKLPTHEQLKEVAIIAASKSDGVEHLEASIENYIPEAPFQFAEDDLTDRSSRFLASEAVREQLTRLLDEELPYALSVEIETYEETPTLIKIRALIWVEKASQKGIVIGKGGEQLKTVGIRARESLERLFGTKVHLECWVRVKEGWADDERALRSLGYENP